MGSFCSVSDTLSVLWDERCAQSTKEFVGTKPFTTQDQWVWPEQQDQSFDASDLKKNAASLTRQHGDAALPAPTAHPRSRSEPNPAPTHLTPICVPLQVSVPELCLRFPLGSNK